MAGAGAPDASTWKLPRLRIGRDGEWFHDDEEVTHPGILENLRGALAVDDTGHYVPVGPVRVPVEVEDTPFVVVRAEAEGERLVLTLNDLSREPLALDTLSFDDRGVPRCRVKAGRFAARLSRPATHQLLEHVEYDDQRSTATLVVGAARHPLPGLDGASRDA